MRDILDHDYLVKRKEHTKKMFRRKCIAFGMGAVILAISVMVGSIVLIIHAVNNAGGKSNTAGKTNTEAQGKLPDGTSSEDGKSEGLLPEPLPGAKTVAIDAGHGGYDVGCVHEDYYEKNANLAIAKRLERELRILGYNTYMVRSEDVAVDKTDRNDLAEENGADLYVSIHLNAVDLESKEKIRGVEVWYTDVANNKQSKAMAEKVLEGFVEATGAKNRGLKLGNDLIVLISSNIPACLVECGFISCSEERALLFDGEYQGKVAKGIASGIYEFMPPVEK